MEVAEAAVDPAALDALPYLDRELESRKELVPLLLIPTLTLERGGGDEILCKK